MAENPELLLPVICGMVFLFLSGAVLSMLKTALSVARKPKLHSLIEAGEDKYHTVLKAAKNPGPFLASLRIVIIFIEIATGLLCALAFSSPLGKIFILAGFPANAAFLPAALVLALASVTFFFIFCEAIPRQIALARPETLCAALFPLVHLCYLLSFPLIHLAMVISAFMDNLLSSPTNSNAARPAPRNSQRGESSRGITEAELRHTLIEGEKSGAVESKERSMVEGVFYLGNRPVGAFMTHRSEILWLDIGAGPDESRQAAEQSGDQFHIPVAGDDLDEVLGMVTVLDIYKALMIHPWPGLASFMRAPYFIPETISGLKAIEAFKNAASNTLFVMDEYGGFAGMLTLRSLIEEIVGGLSQSQREEETIIRQDDGSWLAGGGISIDDAAGELDLPLPGEEHGDYHTLAGFILELAGEIPHTGECFSYNGYKFMIMEMDGNRIDKVRITKTGT